MKKILLSIISLIIAFTALADRTFSFGQISCYSPQMGLVSGGGAVISLTVGDGYIIHPMYGKLYEGQTNSDGSVAYYPSGYAGMPMAQLQGVLLSADLQRMEEHLTSSYGGMTVQMINTYTNAGEDGGRYANSYSEAWSASNRGGRTRDDYSEECSSCGGTGVSKTPNTGGSRSNWVAYYNPNGTKCPYCKRYTSHFHDRCARCNVPR
ncbi:MAG: hypothetical protein NC098_09075 [Lachnoclostridium sp.]|nr:hypothetical protein [Lachnoclostridium sp.]